jgi:hypothetical protein
MRFEILIVVNNNIAVLWSVMPWHCIREDNSLDYVLAWAEPCGVPHSTAKQHISFLEASSLV